MTQLDEKGHKAQMEDMRSFDEQMPCVGIFWYDPDVLSPLKERRCCKLNGLEKRSVVTPCTRLGICFFL
jgi:hypothetical protein